MSLHCIPPAIVLLALVAPASASEINPLELVDLSKKAEVVVIGHVEKVTKLDDSRDEITVHVADTLKGKAAGKTVTFPITCRGGLKDFDPVLREGEKGVFFLQAVVDGKSRLAFFGSVAIFAKDANFKVMAGR